MGCDGVLNDSDKTLEDNIIGTWRFSKEIRTIKFYDTLNNYIKTENYIDSTMYEDTLKMQFTSDTLKIYYADTLDSSIAYITSNDSLFESSFVNDSIIYKYLHNINIVTDQMDLYNYSDGGTMGNFVLKTEVHKHFVRE
jgi:hypothetical protein